MSVLPVNAETVIRLLRRLPPRERLRVLSQVLPELEYDLQPGPTMPDFWNGADLRTLIEAQGVQTAEDLGSLMGGWPEDESIDEFVATIRGWRRQNPAKAELE